MVKHHKKHKNILVIINVLKGRCQGHSVKELCKTYSISKATFYRWETEYCEFVMDYLKMKKEHEYLKKKYEDLLLSMENINQ